MMGTQYTGERGRFLVASGLDHVLEPAGEKSPLFKKAMNK